MSSEPQDELLRLNIADIGSLGTASYVTQVPVFDSRAYSICFWFKPGGHTDVEVVANLGNTLTSKPGWTVYLRGDELAFRVYSEASQCSIEVNAVLTNRDLWHHFVGVREAAENKLRIYLNGCAQLAQPQRAKEQVEPGSVDAHEDLTIGGYTDAAGGHFDHRFGRVGIGLVDDFRIYSRPLAAAEIGAFVTSAQALPPKVAFKAQIKHPQTATFTAHSANAEEPEHIAYLWDFGDDCSAWGKTASHRYAYGGRYTVQLTVVNAQHEQASTQQVLQLVGEKNPFNVHPVFVNGSEGYAGFRIPAIVKATNGDLVAFCEGRRDSLSDATPVIHIVSKRSTDNGKTWSALQVVARNRIAGQEYACMNPAPVVDTVRGSGVIVVVYNKQEYSEWAITQGQGVSRVYCSFSTDNGQTWDGEKDLTLQVHKPFNPDYSAVYADAAREQNRTADWRKQVPTLGHAIQLKGAAQNPCTQGRLFFVGSYTEGQDSVFYTRNYAFWSDDLGETWAIGGSIFTRLDGSSAKGLGEATAVELSDGAVMINSRNYQHGQAVGQRAVCIGRFDEQGQIHYDPVWHDTALTDSGVQASLIAAQPQCLIFANPAHSEARRQMTVRYSYDQGQSWPLSKVIDPGPSAYSDLVVQSDGEIGLLYEQGNHGGIAYVTIGALP